MPQIHNSDLSKELTEGAKIQVALEGIPNRLSNEVVPTMEVNPKFFRTINVIAELDGPASPSNLYVVPIDKKFMLVGTSIIGASVASSEGMITITPKGGAAVAINHLSFQTSVAIDVANGVSNMMLPNPIELEPGSAIVTSDTSDFSQVAYLALGYLVDNPNA